MERSRSGFKGNAPSTQWAKKAGRYTATVQNFVRAGGVITFVLLAGFVTIMLRKERATAGRPPR